MGGFFREPMGIQRGNIGLTKFEFLFFIKIDFLKIVILIPRATPVTQVEQIKFMNLWLPSVEVNSWNTIVYSCLRIEEVLNHVQG